MSVQEFSDRVKKGDKLVLLDDLVLDLGDAGGRFLDFEALVEVNIAPLAHIFAGYRLIDMDGDGDTGNDVYGVDLQLRGWTIGGGLRF